MRAVGRTRAGKSVRVRGDEGAAAVRAREQIGLPDTELLKSPAFISNLEKMRRLLKPH